MEELQPGHGTNKGFLPVSERPFCRDTRRFADILSGDKYHTYRLHEIRTGVSPQEERAKKQRKGKIQNGHQIENKNFPSIFFRIVRHP